MKKFIYPAAIVLLIATSAFTMRFSSMNWKLNEDKYSVTIRSEKIEGSFRGLQSNIQFDPAHPETSTIQASIASNTVNTGNGMRNKHAMQGLDAEHYPNINFVSESVRKTGSGYEASGKLTIKNVTKDITLPFTFAPTADGGVFDGSFSVRPAEYSVDKAGTPEIIHIQLHVEVRP